MAGNYSIKIKLGTRKLQKGSSTFVFDAPVIAMRTLGLHVEDALEVSITDDSTLRIEEEHDPIVSAEFGDTTPTTRHQILSGTERRCGIDGDRQITAADVVIVLQITVSGGQSDDTDMDGAGRATPVDVDALMNMQTAAAYIGIG